MKKLMLCISAGEWAGIQHRPHHFMKRSAKTGWTVLYLEPPATIISPLKNIKMLNRWANWVKGLRLQEENIYLLSPPPILPFANKFRAINKFNQWLISKTIKRAIKKINIKFSSIDMYSFLPNAVDLLNLLEFDRVIYDCVDDHASFTGFIRPRTVYKMEKELMKKANVSFATAKQLMADREGWSNNFHLIPNGAEYEHFAVASKDDGYIPTDIKEFRYPVVGFVGGISDWIDIALIADVAKQMEDIRFFLIGPIATDIEQLRKLPNIQIFGAKRYKELPSYIKHFDICLIPFKINKLTESVNPIKLFEYFSTGKPIISTPLPEVVAYSHVVDIVHNAQEMIESIEKIIAIGVKKDPRIKEREQLGRENSWDTRWQLAVNYIEAGKAKEKEIDVTG
ncbi:MAG: glycosyltransferase [Vulcanibacillus sp.]